MSKKQAESGLVAKNKTDALEVRLNPKEKKAFRDAANIAGLPLSAWVRERLRRSATRELEEARQPIAFLEDVEL